MDLLVIRHAIAAEGKDDALRPLTEEGRRKMRQGARALVTLVPAINLLASSPLVRARQTAEIVGRAYGGLEVTTCEDLIPDHPPEAFAAWLAGHARRGVVAAVGHEPLLGCIVSHLLAARADSFIELKKGGVCLLAFPGAVEPGAALLRWALTPGQLRALKG